MSRNDFAVAVGDATRLNDCWRELAGLFAVRPEVTTDKVQSSLVILSGGDRDWLHRANCEAVASIEISRAILGYDLPLWVRFKENDARVDIQALREISHQTLASGTYLAENDANSALSGHTLWVKNTDWVTYRSSILASRYGHSAAGIEEEFWQTKTGDRSRRSQAGGPGRAPVWNWDDAFAHVIAKANHPDGLPDGHGAQAKIERLLGEFFGDPCPSESQIREKAQKIMRALKRG